MQCRQITSAISCGLYSSISTILSNVYHLYIVYCAYKTKSIISGQNKKEKIVLYKKDFVYSREIYTISKFWAKNKRKELSIIPIYIGKDCTYIGNQSGQRLKRKKAIVFSIYIRKPAQKKERLCI